MRQDRARGVLELARRLAASSEGLTLGEMAEELGVCRRTAERMRDAVWEVFPQMIMDREGVTKRYRIPGGLDGFYQAPSTDEMLELQQAIDHLRLAGHASRAEILSGLERKVRAAMKAQHRSRISTDVDALARAEIAGVRAGPQPVDDPHLVASIREAIMSMRMVEFRYLGGSSPGATRTLVPYGLLFDRMNYLVGTEPPSNQPRNWRLDRIADFRVLDRPGSAPEGFAMEDYAARSFGIYHDQPEHVQLRVRPPMAAEALRWRFHPQQKIDSLDDGSVLVSFTSSGMLELAWHLFTWRDGIEILAPDRLRKTLLDELALGLSIHSQARAT